VNLYERFKAGLLGRKPRICSRVRVFTKPLRYYGYRYHLIDPDGREVAMVRSDAVVAVRALDAILKATR